MKKFLLILFLFTGHFFLFAGTQDFFAAKGREADLFYTRVLAKISYSWEKCKEYFQLMIASVGDDAKYGKRDLGTRAKLKSEEVTDRAVESGKQFLRQEQEKLMRNGETFRRKSSEFSGRVQQGYQEQKEALRRKSEEFRK